MTVRELLHALGREYDPTAGELPGDARVTVELGDVGDPAGVVDGRLVLPVAVDDVRVWGATTDELREAIDFARARGWTG